MNRLQDVEDKSRILHLNNADVEVIADEEFVAW